MFLQIYTQLCICYPVADRASHAAIINTLQNGLERVSRSFPWVAGQVIDEGASGENTGIFKIKSFKKTPLLVIKDLSNDPSISAIDALRKAHFHMGMLDENIVAPRRTLPGSPRRGRPRQLARLPPTGDVHHRRLPAYHCQPTQHNGHDRSRATHEPPLQGMLQ
ncbi:hypothetical protein BDW59DRAFT_164657 [Aspergillus cavernicola]|uniref:Trichothecene 3-O-acetyltransferase-like N-terminal domain-containing protein n=1 Tax=Aspergillus cavernicola TaxID=176166 RepID=A0ABR4HYC3_9EURO